MVKALGAPKLALRSLGRPNRPLRTFAGIRQRYHEKREAIGGGGSVDQKDYAPRVAPDSLPATHLEK